MSRQTANRARFVRGSLIVFSLLAVLTALWSTLAAGAVTTGEVMLFTMLVGSLLFPLFVMLHRSLRRRRSAQWVMLIGSALWMTLSILGAVANISNGMGDDLLHHILFFALMFLFVGMFYASLEQMAQLADARIRQSSAHYRMRLRSHRA